MYLSRYAHIDPRYFESLSLRRVAMLCRSTTKWLRAERGKDDEKELPSTWQ